MTTKRRTYLSPCIEVIKVENEGVIASSPGDLINQDWSRSGTRSTGNTSSGYSASLSDLEDLINDILTLED